MGFQPLRRPARRVVVAAAIVVTAAVATATAVIATVRPHAGPAAEPMVNAAQAHGLSENDLRAHRDGIVSPQGNTELAAFDLVKTTVQRRGDRIVFTERVRGKAGSVKPDPVGTFAGSSAFGYVWPISLNTSTAGFTKDSGILALAATSHPDFDDTPLADENHDGRTDDDGGLWHSHWVVLVPDTTRPDRALKVRDILPGEKPRLPKTWPGAPVYLDSPSYPTHLTGQTVRIEVPLAAVGFPKTFQYDGVTAALKVNADLHDPLLRIENIFDVASGNLSLPGTFRR